MYLYTIAECNNDSLLLVNYHVMNITIKRWYKILNWHCQQSASKALCKSGSGTQAHKDEVEFSSNMDKRTSTVLYVLSVTITLHLDGKLR